MTPNKDKHPSTPERFTLIEVGDVPHLDTFADDVRTGLSASPKRLPYRYFYDAEGSQLFEAICVQPEYYLLRAEREILERHADAILDSCPAAADTALELVELGSGSAEKTRLLIDALLRRQAALRYVPIDVSRAALVQSGTQLVGELAHIRVDAMIGDYADALAELGGQGRTPRLIVWLGSSIGNLERPAAASFLSRVRETMGPADRLFVGIDLRKDASVLEAAYDDAAGVTARFNLNVLKRINEELGGHFDLGAFRHRARYDEGAGRVGMYLVSQRDQRVWIDGLQLEVALGAGEVIHTEWSHKYAPEEIQQLAQSAGLRVLARWVDGAQCFSDVLLGKA